jgi:hypothetical protein
MDAAGPADEHGSSQHDDIGEQSRQLRSLPVDQVIGDALFSLITAAQFKLGRRDARLLIDVSTVAQQHARTYLRGQLAAQIDQLLGELRLAQVTAEGDASKQGEPEENDLDRMPTPPAAGTA